MHSGINTDTWNSLPEDIQKAIQQAASEYGERITKSQYDLETEILADLPGKGMTLYTPPPEERARWMTIVAPLVDEWMAEQGELGREVIETLLKHLE